MIGPAPADTAPESAPVPHLPPEAAVEAQPTKAWPPMLARCPSEPKMNVPWLPSGAESAPGIPLVISPTMLNATAVAPAMRPALSATPSLPEWTPAKYAAVTPTTSGRNGVQAPPLAAVHMVATAILNTDSTSCITPLALGGCGLTVPMQAGQ